jgi:ABC-type multidrug transport system fused ATPase/permease subunit
MPRSLYAFIWRESGRQQMWLCLLTLAVVPLSMVPLELQRRIVNDALGRQSSHSLLVLCALYLAVLLLQGSLKYVLNVYRGRTVEEVVRRLRDMIYRSVSPNHQDSDREEVDKGAIVSMVAAEAEDLGGFVGDSLSVPLLQAGTVVSVLGYLLWVQPLIASLAVLIYLPQAAIVPWMQGVINRYARRHAKLVRKLGDHITAASDPRPGYDPVHRFARINNASFDARIAIYRIKFFLTFLGNFLDAIGPLIVLMVGGWLVIRGSAEVSTLVVFISGFQKVADPWDQLVNFYRTAASAGVKYRLLCDTMPSMFEAVSPAMGAAA